ncbi:MAG: HNH endonuclease [bacterium]
MPYDPQYSWQSQVQVWAHSKKKLSPDLTEQLCHFFSLAFDYTHCPDRAWFGVHKSMVSLVIGGIYLAAINWANANDKGIWLLVDRPDFSVSGVSFSPVASTKTFDVPLTWAHLWPLNNLNELISAPGVWKSYADATKRVLQAPIAYGRENRQLQYGKIRLSDFWHHRSNQSIAHPNEVPNLIRYSPQNQLVDVLAKTVDSNEEFDELSKVVNNSFISETVKESLIRSRKGQGRFRDDLMKYWKRRCSVTGCQEERMLRASHIKPWKDCNNDERLDLFNGLLLIPNLDTAFDQALITFDDNGLIMISSLIQKEAKLLGISESMKVKLDDRHKKYLEYHREQLFKRQ